MHSNFSIPVTSSRRIVMMMMMPISEESEDKVEKEKQ